MGRGIAGAVAITIACGWTPAASAQDAGRSEPDELAQSADGDAIIVTARKVEETLSKVGDALSVRSGEELREAGVRTPDELAQRFTSLTVLPNPTGNLIFIRGVGGFALTANTDPAVGWNYDGVFVARPVGTVGQLFDLERVELLKGPQGALHGRNATGGAIFIVPKKPVYGELGGSGQVSYASRDTATLEGAVNVPLGERHALRVSGWLSQQDSYIRGYEDGPRQQSARVQWAAEPSDMVALRIAADYTHLGGVGIGTTYGGKYVFDRPGNRFLFVDSGLPEDAGIFTPEAQAFRQTITLASLGRPAGLATWRPFQDSEFYGVTGEIEARLGVADLRIRPSFRRSSLDAVAPGAPFGYRHLEEHRQSGIEAQLSGGGGALTWLVGGVVSGERVDVGNRLTFDNQAQFQDETYLTRSQSAFARTTVSPVRGFRLDLSARAIHDQRDQRIAADTVTLSCTLIVAGLPSCPNAPVLGLHEAIEEIPFPVPAAGAPPQVISVNGVPTGARISRSFAQNERNAAKTSVSWRAGAELDLTAHLLGYASVGSANRPGGINNAVGFETYKPERLTAYTAGARWADPGSWLHGAIELFWWDYRDQHVTSLQPDLATPPNSRQITRNIGRSRIRGVDFELDAKPGPRTDLRLAVQYLDAKYLSFSFPQVSTATPPLTGCEAVPATGALYSVDCTGVRPFASPEWTVTVRAEQRVPLGAHVISLRGHSRYVSSFGIGAAFLPEQVVPESWTNDAEVAVTAPGRQIEAALFVRNIGDRRVRNWAISHPATNALVVSSTAPRTIGVRLGGRF